MKHWYAILLLCCAQQFCAYGQSGKFKKLSRPEKCWVLLHPFVARKAWKCTRLAVSTTAEIKKEGLLASTGNGDQLDAFRHSFWMALLSSRMHERKARKLGVAHEKGNRMQFERNSTEDGEVPDSISCRMDLLNNEAGISIGRSRKKADPSELRTIVTSEIKQGKMLVIRRDAAGNFLDCNGSLLKEELLKGRWKNDKCLVPSNTP